MLTSLKSLKLKAYELVLDRLLLSPNIKTAYDKQQFFYHAFKMLSYNGISGDYLEFGCYRGITFSFAYKEAKRWKHGAKLWAFDSFEGLPPNSSDLDDHPVWQPGSMANSLEEFHTNCRTRGVPRSAYETVKGFYSDSLPRLSSESALADIAMVYIDCDMYSSTKTVLEWVLPRLKHGAIVAFDDYFSLSATQMAGERRAMVEALTDDSRWEFVPFQRYSYSSMAFMVEDRQIQALGEKIAA